MPTSASSQTSVAASSHSFSMPSAVENDQLVLIVAIGTGDDEHDTPADWTEEWVAGTDDIALYVYTRKAGVGGAGGTSVSTTTGSDLVASAIGFNFGQNTDVDTFAPDGSGNSSFDLKHQSFTGSIPTSVTFCSIACWEFARTLSLWPIDYPNNQEVEEQNNCNLAAALSAVRSTEPTRPDFTIDNAAVWSGVGFYVKPSGTTPTAVNINGIKVATGVDEPSVSSKNSVSLNGIVAATHVDEPTAGSSNSTSLDGITAGTGVGDITATSASNVLLNGVKVATHVDEPTAGSSNSTSLDGITVGTGVDDIGSGGSTNASLNGISAGTGSSALQVTTKNSTSLDGITVGTGVDDIGSGGSTNVSPNGVGAASRTPPLSVSTGNAVSLDSITVKTGVDDIGSGGAANVSLNGISVASRVPAPSVGSTSNALLDGVVIAAGVPAITGGYVNPPVTVSLDGVSVGTNATDELGTATYAEPKSFFWCCCECICNLIGDIFGPDDGVPECQGKIDIVPNPCDATFDYERVKWEVVRTSDVPESVMLSGDYTDYVAARDDAGYLHFYMSENGTYEIRVWYQTDGYAPPCDGLPDENNKFTRGLVNEVECCPNSCPIDPSAISSSVTLSGWTDEVLEIPGDFPTFTIPPGFPLFGVYNCNFPPNYYDEVQYNNLSIFNHTHATLEYKVGDTEFLGCVASWPTPKIALLGDFDTYMFRHYIQNADPGNVAATASFRAWGYFGNLIPAAGGGIETEPDGTPSLSNTPSQTYRIVVKCLTDVRGTFHNPDFSTFEWPAPFIPLGPNKAGEFFEAKNIAGRPCNTNYAAFDEIGSLLLPGGGSIWWISPRQDFEVGSCDPAWGNYDQGPGINPPNPRATWTVN